MGHRLILSIVYAVIIGACSLSSEAEDNAAPTNQVNSMTKELIVLATPPSGDKYYAEVMDEIYAFHVNYIETGKSLLRDYVNATIGFEDLAELTEKSPKSLMRMLSPSGNPTAKNLFSIINFLQREEGLELQIKTA